MSDDEYIGYYSGGIAFHKKKLKRSGELEIDKEKKFIPQDIVKKAFQDAKYAKQLPPDTKYEGGCVRMGGVHTWCVYKGKSFLPTSLLKDIFNENTIQISKEKWEKDKKIFEMNRNISEYRQLAIIFLLVSCLIFYIIYKYFY